MSKNSGNQVCSEVKEKVDELSLLLVMTAENDQDGVNLLCELLDQLEELAKKDPASKAILQANQELKNSKKTLKAPEFFKFLEQFVNKASAFCEGASDLSLVLDRDDTKAPASGLEESVDQDFLAEFIENHRMQLEDLESWLLNSEFKNEEGEDVEALVKRYLHSLKGDAGSIGLNDLSATCHYVEDSIASTSVKALAPGLLLFREWISAYLDALVKKEAPQENSEKFKQRFLASSPKQVEQNKLVKAADKDSGQSASTLGQSYALTGEMDIFQEFVAEAEEHLGNVESTILEAEGAYNKDSIDTIFRGIHSLKGGSAYFSFKEMTETSHLLENMLDQVRTGKRELDQELTSLVLTYIDLQKNLLSQAKSAIANKTEIKRSQNCADFLVALNNFASGKTTQPIAVSSSEVKSAVNSEPKQVSDKITDKVEESAGKSEKLEVKNFVKIDTQRLDHLIDSIGEMVIYSSMLIRRTRDLLSDHEDVLSITHRVEKFTRDLQDVGMSMRLVPIKGLFQKMSRLVWDTSKKINKEINFTMDGEDTELDRNLIDKLADPLMHMVRNALDHGVEMPDDRVKAGKARLGTVHLSASYSGGSVLIKIRDDGRGLDPEKLLAKAREKGIISEGQRLSEQETFQLIFAAGFSTAAVITDISGRGVGMDVVRRNVESLRGRIHIDSQVGVGTTFTIELPLTLAIIDGIEVLVGKEHLILPSLAIIEFVKPNKDTLSYTLDQGETFFFRGKYLPVYRLADLYDIEPSYSDILDATLIVVENHEELVALAVDEIVGELSTVIKSLGALFSEVKGVSGCAVMPNGDAALILDIRSLVQLARTDYQLRAKPYKSEKTQAENLMGA